MTATMLHNVIFAIGLAGGLTLGTLAGLFWRGAHRPAPNPAAKFFPAINDTHAIWLSARDTYYIECRRVGKKPTCRIAWPVERFGVEADKLRDLPTVGALVVTDAPGRDEA